MLNRRGFLGMLGGLALSEAIPFNRVWSFPKNIVIANAAPEISIVSCTLSNGIVRYAYYFVDRLGNRVSPDILADDRVDIQMVAESYNAGDARGGDMIVKVVPYDGRPMWTAAQAAGPRMPVKLAHKASWKGRT
jgi:hypothetical protein